MAKPFEPGNPGGPGRPKGMQNRVTKALKEAILEAAERAGGEGGTVGYLVGLATEHPTAFASLLGRVLPMTVSGEDGGDVRMTIRWEKDA